MMDTTIEKLKKNRVVSCLECGKCTAICPISRFNDSYSPRRLVTRGLLYGMDDLISDKLLWSCLTCLLCSQRCPVDVRYSEYMREVRNEAHDQGYWGNPSHGGALHHIMEIAATPELKQHRTDWITDDLKTKTTGEVLYFVGCLPYYEVLFGQDLAMSPISIARDTVRILNRLGIEPVVMDNERCCGHDLYWLGQLDKFDSLGRLNLQEIEQSGAKTVVTACPECALTLKQLYAMRLAGVGFQVKHISEVIAESIGELRLNPVDAEVTFQDPCRLGRYLNDYDSPRTALAAIPGLTLHEMAHSGPGAICCGTTNWMNCDATSRQIQLTRLAEAKTTGAQTLVTTCPKCQIHFRCSGCGDESEKIDIQVTDLVNLVASSMGD